MPRFLEEKLRAEYGNNPHAIYGTMNAVGAMKGNKETAKGRAMEAKHERDTARPMHPKMVQRAQLVKEAHAHLTANVPEYATASPRQKFMMTQHHANLRLGRVK